jgi:hypothetical protein
MRKVYSKQTGSVKQNKVDAPELRRWLAQKQKFSSRLL